MENQLPVLTAFDDDEVHTQDHQSSMHTAVNLNKSTSNLPPASNQSRVSRIKQSIAMTGKDDDLERAHDSKMSAQ